MKFDGMMAKGTACAVAVSLALGGCATGGGAGGSGGSAGNNKGFECNTAIAAGVGAVIGGLLASGTNRVRGAALGAGIAALACMAVNYHSQQVKSAQQVQDEYRAAHRGKLPEETTVVRYDTSFKPASIQPGQKTALNSYVEVAKGSNDPNPVVEQEMTLYKPDSSGVLKKQRKPLHEGASAGGFNTEFNIAMPEGVPEGVYPVKTALFLNGNQVKTRDAKLQVVMVNGTMVTHLAFAD